MSENKTYNITELIKCKFVGLKSRESIMKYIKSGELSAKNVISNNKSRYTRYLVTDDDVEEFYKNLKKR